MACWYKRALQKKGLRILKIARDTATEYAIQKLCNIYNIQYGLIIYTIVSANPIDVIISLLAAKLGLSKVVITLIIAFLI